MNWATYLYIALTLVGLGIALEGHGKEKKGKESVWMHIVSVIVTYSLLYFGGFFK